MSTHPSGDHLPIAIEHLHHAIREHRDPAAKAELTRALSMLLQRQKTDMESALPIYH